MTLPPPEVCQQIFAAWVLLGAPDWTEADRTRLLDLLAKHSLSINDLPQIFLAVNVAAAPSRPNDKVYERCWRLFGQLFAAEDPVRTTARKKLGECLTKHNLSWNGPNGFTAVLLSYWADHNTAPTNAAAPQQGSATDEPAFNVLELILALFDDYVVATPAQHTVIALWTLATHVYNQFEYSPRLGLVSPTSGYGKTTLFKLLKQLASEPKLTKNASPASIYRRLEHRPRTTYLLDEAENQGLLTDRVLRAVIDAGYERGGSIDRADGEFPVFFPCAYAIRGETNDVPLSILSRSLIINMQLGTPRKRFVTQNDRAFFAARELIAKWRATVFSIWTPKCQHHCAIQSSLGRQLPTADLGRGHLRSQTRRSGASCPDRTLRRSSALGCGCSDAGGYPYGAVRSHFKEGVGQGAARTGALGFLARPQRSRQPSSAHYRGAGAHAAPVQGKGPDRLADTPPPGQ